MKLDKQQIIIIGVGIVLIGGFTMLRYVPIVRHKLEIMKMIDAQESAREQIRANSMLVPDLKYQKKSLAEELAPFSTKIPEGRNFAQLWQQIADAMNESRLSDQLIRPGQELKSEQICSIPMTIECSGSLDQIYSFFNSLEQFDRLVRIEEMTLENDNEYSGALKLFAKANVYYQSNERDDG